uniref:Uncharacterized protein n=1 Tax=Cacopsylla melanoneura TaxID=428564 RepID=A0A8D8XM32_9HEMI
MGLDFAAEDLLGGLMVELDDQGQGLGGEELAEVGLFGGALVVDTTFVELLEDGNSVVVYGVLAQNVSIGRGDEHKIVDLGGDLVECLGQIGVGVLEQTGNDHLVVVDELLDLFNRGELLGGRTGLLQQPVDNVFTGTSTTILNDGLLLEELECWVATDTVLFGERRVLCGVNLGQFDVVTVRGEALGSLGVLGNQLFAVTAPWGIELNQDVIVLFDRPLEVILS